MTIATLTLALCIAASQSTPFTQKIPGQLVSIQMLPVQGGSIRINDVSTTVKPFFIAATETTWDLYDVFAFRYDLPKEQQLEKYDTQARPSKPYGAVDRGFGHSGYPAIGITQNAAEKFCEWLSKVSGRKYRLPTEAEWELAARTHGAARVEDVAWVWENSDDSPQPVGKKASNSIGAVDMLGNVGEWVSLLKGGSALAGGSFMDKASKVGFSLRAYYDPKWQERDPQRPKSKWWLSDANFAGFRVVCEP